MSGNSRTRLEAATVRWRVSCPAFWLFLLYSILIWSCELADLLCWLVGIPQVTLLSRAAALILTAVIAVKTVGRPEVSRIGIDPFFLLGSAVLIGFFALKAVGPDISYDTQNYHLLCQIPGFLDNLNYHVLPGRFQMYGFRLGDRMFYPFRLILGLRMGTMLNAAAMLVIYRQITVFFVWFKGTFSETGVQSSPILKAAKRLLTCPSILAFLVICHMNLILESGSYMVELLALPFFLEMLFLLLREEDGEKTKREAIVFCLSGGIFFCLKMTNIVYLAPLVLCYIWKIRKKITLPLFIGCLAAGVVPVCIYLIYNGISTGNPIFPYYNTIFHSPYFVDADFKDIRWGPSGLKEIFLWPYYMIRYPEYHMSELPCSFNWDLAAGYASMAGLLAVGGIHILRKKERILNREILMILVYAISFLAWAATTGHTRYFMAGYLLGGIILVCAFLRLLNGRGWIPALTGLILLCPFLGRAGYGLGAVYKGHEWSFRSDSAAVMKTNAKWIFRDHEFFPKDVKDKVDMILLTWTDCGSYARLIGEDVPVYNRRAITWELSSRQEQYLSTAEQFMREGKGVYDMFPQSFEVLNQYLEWMNEIDYYVDDMFLLDNSMSGYFSFNMARLSMADGRKNEWYFGYFEEETEGPHFTKESNYYRLSAITGDPDYWFAPYAFDIIVTATDGVNTRQVAALPVGNVEYERQETVLDLTGLEGEIKLTFRSAAPGKRGVVLNPELIKEQ